MNGKEKLQRALSHREGPVPLDMGSTSVSGIHCSVVEALRSYYGLEPRPVKIHEPYQMLGLIEEDLQEALGIDVNGVAPRNTMFGFPAEAWKQWKSPWGQEVLVPGQFITDEDDANIYIYPQGDTQAKPSGKMPRDGFFFDAIIRQDELDEDHLNPEDNLEEFSPISEQDLSYFKNACAEASTNGRGLVATFGGTAFGDIAMVPAVNLKAPKGIRDVSEWYISTVSRPEYIHQVFSKQCEIALENLKKIHAAVGELPDAIFLCGTDFGTQTSQFCSVDSFNSLYAPYYRAIADWVHTNTSWKVFKHSCGAVEPFIESFIDCGIDILNPVQCSATGMDPQTLKNRYGDKMVFWGGVVDTQKTLPFGSRKEVEDEVLKRLEIFSKKGGFVCNAIHNIQAQTPVENLVSLFESLKAFNKGRA